MKLNSFTHSVLNNFSSINNSMVFHEGNEIRVMPENKTILAEATVPDSFDRTFGIYDVRQLMGLVSLSKDPDLKLNDKYLEIKSAKSVLKYFFTDPSRIVTPSKRINVSSAEVTFSLPSEELKTILKTSQVLGVEDLLVSRVDGEVLLTVLDKSNPTTHSVSFEVEGKASEDFKAYLKIPNLKLMEDDYEVSLSSKGVSLFTGKNPVKYYIALEADSSF
jgi:gp45 sliding clamp, C terminal